MMAKFSDWLDARSGLRTWLRAKKAQAVPAHSFFFCFGGISLLIIILQVVGGSVIFPAGQSRLFLFSEAVLGLFLFFKGRRQSPVFDSHS